MTEQKRIDKGLWWDRAWSLVEGCTPVASGCAHCWSARQAHSRMGHANLKIRARYGDLTDSQGRWTGEVRLQTQDLDKPLRVKKPTTWAIWNDLFHEAVPDDFIARVVSIMSIAKRHIFQVLTKRPERMGACFKPDGFGWRYVSFTNPYPLSNVWLGGSISNQDNADRIVPVILDTPAAVRFLSLEPMLGPVWLRPDDDFFVPGRGSRWLGKSANGIWDGLDWVIVGCESGPNRRHCDIEWIRSVQDQCVAADTPFFLKQMDIDGKLVKMPELDGERWDQMPETKSRDWPTMEPSDYVDQHENVKAEMVDWRRGKRC